MSAVTHTTMTEFDEALIARLQENPRAPWAELARHLACSPATVRRAWERLRDSERAWVTSYPGPASGVVMGVVDLQARPGRGLEVAAALVSQPRAFTVSSMTGGRDLNTLVFAKDLAEFREVTQVDLPAIPGVAWTRNSVVTTLYADGADWMRRQRRQAGPRVEARRMPSDGVHRWPLLTHVGALERDGRASYQHLGRDAAGSARISRELHAALASGALRQRVDVAPGAATGQIAMSLWLQVPPQHVDTAGSRLGSHPAVRLCASLAGGSANLYVIVWLASLGEATQMEAALMELFPAVVLDRSLIVNYHKRLGWVFDRHGRRTGHVPWLGGAH